ncbi:conjugal transfer protein [Streptomyces sp. NA02950]|uniref:conjugal transfer protein n=1 Tax=Streptomyces sp. NA02950 TaxID=2742137 RepID=UPI00158FCEC5|nr:conjugal transfer protein [Streptomyces sp. NA02950]QKV90392.1 conjugal transfer protein [Streptomyces sp. NA02950]QKV97275.1 conjugal transfer protein [Streptomyces sp. NA02950]
MPVFPRRQASLEPGGPPSQTAGVSVRLLRARRWVRLGRVAVWGALAAGPAALVIAAASPEPGPVVQKTASAPRPVRSTADPSGYAELFVTLWLRSDSRSEERAEVRRLRAMAPGVDLPEPREGAQPDVDRVVAVRSARLSGGAWSVTVAAQSGGQVRYFAVPLVASGRSDAGAFVVTAGPARVAGPSAGRAPESAYRVTVPEGSALSSTVSEFLSAYLAGVGETERYLAPGVRLAPVSGPGYQRVEVEEVSADDAVAKGPVAKEGTVVRVQVGLRAVDALASWPLVYSLRVSARDGRWEIASLDAESAGRGHRAWGAAWDQPTAAGTDQRTAGGAL